jgi:cytochrome b561
MKRGSSIATVAETVAPEASYDRRTILLHWVTAGLVGLLWSIAQVIDLFPKGPPKIAARSVHVALGLSASSCCHALHGGSVRADTR